MKLKIIGIIIVVLFIVLLGMILLGYLGIIEIGGKFIPPSPSIYAYNNQDTITPDIKIMHRGGDSMLAGDWKLSIVEAGTAPAYVISDPKDDRFSVGDQIITTYLTNRTVDATNYYNLTNSALNLTGTGFTNMSKNISYDVKLVYIPFNITLLDSIVEVK